MRTQVYQSHTHSLIMATTQNQEYGPQLPAKTELEKCEASPYYFYTNYFKVDGDLATTNLSEKEFNRQWAVMEKYTDSKTFKIPII